MKKRDIKFVVDVETTGLDYRREKIIEIAAVKLVDNVIEEKFDSLVNPMQNIRLSSTNIHGITEQMIMDSPTIEEVLPRFLDFIEDKPIIGHNIIFDYSYINFASLTLYGKPLENQAIDTLHMYKEVYPDERSHGLASLIKRFNVTSDTTHRALADAECLAKVYHQLNEIYEKRFSWQLSQISNIDYLFERYLRIQTLIQSLQNEMGDLKSIFKVYFDRGGESISSSLGDLLTVNSKHHYQYDLPKLIGVLEKHELLFKAMKINTGQVDRLVYNTTIEESIREEIRNCRVNLSNSSNVTIVRADKTQAD